MKRLRFFLLSACPVLLLITVSGWWLQVQHRQYTLNRQLIVALDYNEGKQALALVNAGADPNTPYIPSPRPSLTSLLNHLLRRRTSPPDDGPTAFMMACGVPYSDNPGTDMQYPDDPKLIATMRAHGANLNTQTESGWTALLGAMRVDHVHVAKLLLEQGADVNVADDMGMTPLMWAALSNSPEIVKTLLAHGAKVNVQDSTGQTALHYAVKPTYRVETMRLLLTHGANPNIGDMSGTTALTLAQKSRSPAIIALFGKVGQ